MDVRGPARSRRRKKESIRPEEILAWFNLAQTVAQDKSILGGLINAVARGNREEAIASERMRGLESARRVGQEAPGDRPPAPPTPRETMRMEQLGAEPSQPAQGGISPEEEIRRQLDIINTFETILTQEHARPGGSGEQTKITSPEHRESIEAHLRNAKTSLKMLQERAAAAPLEAAAPAEQVTAAQMQARIAQQAAGQLAAPVEEPNFQEKYRQAMAIEEEAQLAQATEFAAQRALTYEDLAGMAASAESGEALRAALRMLPQVMKSDPAFAPRSLSELLFGGGGPSSAEATNNLISIFLKRQGREKTPQERMYKMEQARRAHAKALETERMTPVKEQRELATTHRIWGAAELDKKRGEMLDARKRKYDRENERRSRSIKKSKGSWWGTAKEAVFTDYGVYLDAMKNPETAQLMVPDRFMKGGKPIGMSQAQQLVYGELGDNRAVKGRVNDLLRFHHRGVSKPSKTSAPTQQQKDSRKDRHRKAVATAKSNYDLNLGDARDDKAGAQGKVKAFYDALRLAIANAKTAGVVYVLTGASGGTLKLEEPETGSTGKSPSGKFDVGTATTTPAG